MVLKEKVEKNKYKKILKKNNNSKIVWNVNAKKKIKYKKSKTG